MGYTNFTTKGTSAAPGPTPTPVGVENVRFGIIPAASTVTGGDITAGSTQKIIALIQSYTLAPPSTALTPGTSHKLFVAEPSTEPLKAGFLWWRNLGTTYIRPAVTVATVGTFRVYTFEAQEATNFLPQYAGPVFLSTTAAVIPPPPPTPYNTFLVRLNACLSALIPVYSTAPEFIPGITVYTNTGLTVTPVATLIIFENEIYNIATGVVGTITGDRC
jgi:hypothetical protein